ncbi:MAG: hypothetical protein IJ454_02205 [Clostridia bacterium]|nr:hypothetical protein [Clostridia bacterium]
METEEIIQNQRKRRRKKTNISLGREYLRHFYVFILTALMCFPGYAAEVLIYNMFVMKDMPPFLSAFVSMLVGGIVSTLPFLVLNIILVVKKKKYYAIAFQIMLVEIIGMVFFVYNQMGLAG